jgi:hypothetical protein
VTFEITMIWPGVYLVVASSGEVVGIFGTPEEIDRACEQYRARRLH